MATGIKAHSKMWSEIENTYDVFIFDETIFTTATCDADIVDTWIAGVKSENRDSPDCLIVGLDVECLTPDRDYDGRDNIGTLQLCVGRRCLIFQIFQSMSIPQSLVDFLSDQDNIFVGVGMLSKLEKLTDEQGIGNKAYSVDLGVIAAERYNRQDLKKAGLRELARIVVGKDVEKQQVGADWDHEELSDAQVEYACIDAFVSLEIGRKLVIPTARKSAN